MKRQRCVLAACALLLTGCSGNTVTVHAARKDAMMEAKQWWCTFFEVSKSALAGIDEYAAFDYDLTADNMGNIDTDVILRHAGK